MYDVTFEFGFHHLNFEASIPKWSSFLLLLGWTIQTHGLYALRQETDTDSFWKILMGFKKIK